MRTIIIDDIEKAIRSLRTDIEDYCPQLEIVGTANSVVSGAKLVKSAEPDVIFLDIEMEDGNGFDLLDIVGKINAHVIITTGSKEYAIKAFRYAATDYLLKPVDPDDLIAAVARIPDAVMSENPSALALHTAEEIYFAQIPTILYCQANGNYTTFYFTDGKKLLVTKTLKEFESQLPGKDFIRTHQSYLVNLDHVKSYLKEDGGYLLMSNDVKIPVSVRKKTLVMQSINQRF